MEKSSDISLNFARAVSSGRRYASDAAGSVAGLQVVTCIVSLQVHPKTEGYQPWLYNKGLRCIVASQNKSAKDNR
jgi:hypothetical protein